jgi:hypothetical protein
MQKNFNVIRDNTQSERKGIELSRKTVSAIMVSLLVMSTLALASSIQPVKANGPITLLANLEYPSGLWIKNNRVYITETNGRNTGYGGKICLDLYNAATGQKTVLVDHPNCSDAVVVARDNKIYLTSYQGTIPGNSGLVTVVDPATNNETHLLNIEVASREMFIDANDNILIIGSSDTPSAKSIYLLPSGNYTNPVVLKTGLGRTWCISKSGAYTYFSDLSAIRCFNDTDGLIETFLSKSVISISLSSEYLYYADYFAGTVGRINIQNKFDQTLVTGLNAPTNVRYDDIQDRLYYLEAGTIAGQYKDGTLKVIEHIQGTRTHQGDIILTGNDLITIEGTLWLNGSIVTKENATLILRNVIVNFTQTHNTQFTVIFQDPVNGNPHLLVEDAILASNYYLNIELRENSTGNISALKTEMPINAQLSARNKSVLSISNSTGVDLMAYDSSSITVSNCSLGKAISWGSPSVSAINSIIDWSWIISSSVNCSIIGLKPGFFNAWNFRLNCSVSVHPSGWAPTINLTNTQVGLWSFHFYGLSNATLSKCTLREFITFDNSTVVAKDSIFTIGVYARHDTTVWLVNCTGYPFFEVYGQAEAYIYWYANVHVLDSTYQNVPSANVTAIYPNATIAESKTTDANGWARLTLMEKMKNATGSYPIGNYTVTAKYETHEGQQSVNMTGNKEITLPLDFVIPEFPSFLVLPLFIIATLLAAIFLKKRKYATT